MRWCKSLEIKYQIKSRFWFKNKTFGCGKPGNVGSALLQQKAAITLSVNGEANQAVFTVSPFRAEMNSWVFFSTGFQEADSVRT